MLTNAVIDQSRTFAGLVFLSCQPKLKFGSMEQEMTKDGRGKWELEVLGAVRQFGGTKNEVLKVGIASSTDPGKGIPPFSPIELGDLEIGVMEKTKKNPDGTERIIGVNVWLRASEIKMAASQAAGSKAA